MRTLVFAVALLAPSAALAGSEFDRAVHWVEAQYGVSRVHVPMLGFASFVAGAAGRPFGAMDFHLAIFQGEARPRRDDSLLRDLGFGWRTIVRVTEKRGDQVQIYGRDEDGWVQMLMVTLDHDDAVVMQFKLRPTRLLEFVAQQARDHHGH